MTMTPTMMEVMAMTMVEVAMMRMKSRAERESGGSLSDLYSSHAGAGLHATCSQLYNLYDLLYRYLVWNIYFYYFHCVYSTIDMVAFA